MGYIIKSLSGLSRGPARNSGEFSLFFLHLRSCSIEVMTHIKDFDGWNENKKEIHNRVDGPFFHTREIWWCSLGLNIGFEQDGSSDDYYRPVLILKGLGRWTCLAVPLTTSARDHKLRPSIGVVEGKEDRALISQIRVIDAKRLVRKVGYLESNIFEIIRKTVKDMI